MILVGVCIVIIGVLFGGYTQFFMKNDANAVKIVSLELTPSETPNSFLVTVQIQNTGRYDIQNAQIHYIFIKDNDLVDSETQALTLETQLQRTCHASFNNVAFTPESTYKAIATIYLGNDFLDSKTITKQFP